VKVWTGETEFEYTDVVTVGFIPDGNQEGMVQYEVNNEQNE